MILEDIVESTKERVETNKKRHSIYELKEKAFAMPIDQSFPFKKALEKEDGYVVDDQLSYKEDEANGLKYSQCIEKNTKIFYNKSIDKIVYKVQRNCCS